MNTSVNTNTNTIVKKEEDIITDLVIYCPHCEDPIVIEKLNCRIFRHGTLVASGKQIDPHASKELCDYFVEKNKIYGCGKPFQIVKNEKAEFVAVVCGYI
jgi:hypothetical protein